MCCLSTKQLLDFIQCFLSLALVSGFSARSKSVTTMTSQPPSVNYLPTETNGFLAHVTGKGESPGIVFLNGFQSVMSGRKALSMEAYCRDTGRSFARFDYRGHGLSSGRFEDLTLSDWIEDSIAMLDYICEKRNEKVLLVGSSMGAWIAIHVAVARPHCVAGIVGIASAPDFTRDVYESLSRTELEKLDRDGIVHVASEYSDEKYPITKRFLYDAKKWYILNGEPSIHLDCPVHLIHGQEDVDIPWQRSVALSSAIETDHDVRVSFVKKGDHRLSRPEHLEKIKSIVNDMLHEQT